MGLLGALVNLYAVDFVTKCGMGMGMGMDWAYTHELSFFRQITY